MSNKKGFHSNTSFNGEKDDNDDDDGNTTKGK